MKKKTNFHYLQNLSLPWYFQEQLYTGSDIKAILEEVKKAQEVLNKIKDMRHGLLGTALVSVMNEVNIKC